MITIRELTKKTNVTVRTLRYYDTIGLLTPSGKTEGGHRLYAEEDVSKLYKILFLKDLGFKLNDIKNILSQQTWSWDNHFEEQFRYIQDQKIKLELMEKKMQELQTIFHLEGELNECLLLELMKLYKQDDTSRKKILAQYFQPSDYIEVEKLPKMSSMNPADREWIQLLKEIRERVGDDPNSTKAQKLIKKINKKVKQVFGEDDEWLETFWEIRKSPKKSRQMKWYPIEKEVTNWLDEAFNIYTSKNTKKEN